jgi:hypothetical protein
MANRLIVSCSVVIVAVTCSIASILTSPAQVHMNVSNQAGAPAALTSVAIENDNGRQVSLIHYRMVNQTEHIVKSVSLKIVVFDRWRKPVGGEEFSEHMSLKGHQQAEFLTPLRNYAADGGRVLVFVSAIKTDKDTWHNTSDLMDFVQEMKTEVGEISPLHH